MAYTYLDLTNEVLARFNEVSLTSSGFGSARGFQIQCKNAVNDAINYVNQRDFNWPFNHETHTETLVAGTTRYTIPATAKTVDYETFRLVKDDSLGCAGGSIDLLNYYEYVDKHITQEDKSDVGSIPTNVVRTPDNNYLLYPYPDKAYSLKFEYYTVPTQLSAATDVPTIPVQFRQVIVDGATAYCYQFRGEAQQYAINFDRFEKGITHMQTLLSNRFDYLKSTVIHRTVSSYGSRVF